MHWTILANHLETLELLDTTNCATWDYIVEHFIRPSDVEDMNLYWTKRNMYNLQIKPIVETVITELNEMFEHNECIKIKLMSSYGANTNLYAASDIDIGIIVQDMNEQVTNMIGVTLINNGYSYSKYMNDYYCYNKFVDGIEIEIKVRDMMKSQHIIQLHDYLDTKCDERQKIIYTYLKYKIINLRPIRNKAYSVIKMLFYNIALLQINPKCTSFITNI